MRLTHFAAAALVSVTVSTEAHPATTTGNQLVQYCERFPDAAMWYISGVIDVVSMKDVNNLLGDGLKFCPPKGVNYGQMIEVTCKWLKDNPKDRHLDGPIVVPLALSEAWPCAK